jgi:SH3-like domain-containing protein
VISRQGRWLKVRDFENDTGWVYRPLTGKTPHHIVKARIVNIRSGPGTNTKVLGQAQYGELLRTVEKRKAWVKVRQPSSGVQGWVSRPLLWGW